MKVIQTVLFSLDVNGGINEFSSGWWGCSKFGSSFTEEEEKLIQEMCSSAAIMGSGSGRIPAEGHEGHERCVDRHDRQGLQNFKPNRYFGK